MRKIKEIHIHYSASRWGNAEEIDRWHKERVPPFNQIGYHAVVLNQYPTYAHLKYSNPDPDSDGKIEYGREIAVEPASIEGRNKHAIAICIIGKGNYSKKQLASAHLLAAGYAVRHGLSPDSIYGHRELDPDPDNVCPMLDMDEFRVAVGRLLNRPAHPKHRGIAVDRKNLYDKMLEFVDVVDPRLDDKIRKLPEVWIWNFTKFKEFQAGLDLFHSIVTSVVILAEKAQKELPITADISGEGKIEISKAKMEVVTTWLNERVDIPKIPEIFEAYIIRTIISVVVGGLNRWGKDWLHKLRPDLDPGEPANWTPA